MTVRHLLDVDDLSPGELAVVLDTAEEWPVPQVLAGRGVALLFEKPSARTRNSTEMAVVQLGGHPLSLRAEELGIDTREPAEDVARTLACYHAVIAARVYDHTHLTRMAAVSPVPVLNLLSDRAHPCQAIADLLTLRRHFGRLDGITVAYVGDWNNVASSLALALGPTGGRLRVACPADYAPPADEVAAIVERGGGVPLELVHDPHEAVKGADAVYTDVWTSMGQEAEAAARRRAFAGFTVDGALLDEAGAGAVFLHCLPAHRGEEVDAAVIDDPRSLVWEQAANRLHAARAVLLWLARSPSAVPA